MKKLFTLLTLLVLTGVQAFAQMSEAELQEALVNEPYLYIRNTRSKNYATCVAYEGRTGQTNAIDDNSQWKFVKAGDADWYYIPVKIYNLGNSSYLNDIKTNSYTTEEASATTWYLHSNAQGWNILKSTSDSGQYWNDDGAGWSIDYSSEDDGSYWLFEIEVAEYGALSYSFGITNKGNTATIVDYDWNATSLEFPTTITHDGTEYPVHFDFEELNFLANTHLTSITIPEGITRIKTSAFERCSALTTVTLPSTLTSIGIQAFYNCSSLTTINIPEGVTSIGRIAFLGCSSLTTVTLPSTLKTIDDNAFKGGPSIVYFNSETPPSGGYMSVWNTDLVFVPAASVAAYQTALSSMSSSLILSNEIQKEWDITVEAQDNTSGIWTVLNTAGMKDEYFMGILNLKVTGTINSYDFMLMRNQMVNLQHVDLSEAQVVYNAYQHYAGCHTENDIFPAYAFHSAKLRSCQLPKGITRIENEAFSSCSKLTQITIPASVTVIGSNAFGRTALKSVQLPESLQEIQGRAFGYTSLEEIKFPIGLKYIGGSAFSGCSSLREVRIPSSIERIEGAAFGSCSGLKKVYTYTVEPVEISQSTFSTEAFQGTLYIPETAYQNYYWHTQWSQFLQKEQFNEPYEYFYLNKDFTMNPETPRLEGETNEETNEVEAPDADFNAGSGFIVNGDKVQELGDVHLKNDGNGNGGSVIGNGNNGGGNIHAKNVHIDIEVQGGRWYFFCFPYQIDKTNIKYKGNYVLRYYDGEVRAQNGSGGWTNVAGDYLERGVGYIFQGDKNGTLTLKIADVEFNSEDRETQLKHHDAREKHDAGWNFVGNPHTAYFDIQDMGYDYPITVWNGSTYEALNPADDEHVLHPYQAFFVQKPDGTEEITFRAEHRQTKIQKDSQANSEARAERRLAKRMANVHRHLVNLTLGSNDSTVADRTRVVFNEESRAGYETERDAAKFMAAGVAQLYSLGTGRVKYAINERPTDNGRVALGYVAPAAGSYTIALTRADVGVVLKDKLTGASHDFEKGNYTFASEAGTFDDRFLLVKSGEATGVGGVFAAGEAVVDVADGRLTVRGADKVTTTVTTLNGAVVGTLQGNGSLTVQPGVYVVKVGSHSQKVMVK